MQNDEIVRALTFGFHFLEKEGKDDEARTLLKLRNIINENGTPTVWSNKRAFRRYQGQDKTSVSKTYNKYRVIMIKEEK